jgi:pilus assembly protein CpaC
VRSRKVNRSVRELVRIGFPWTVACVAAILAMPAGAQPAEQGARELDLTVGKSLVVNSSSVIERVAVGYGDVADARAVDPKQVLLSGKAPGETSLIVWQQGGNLLYFDVVVKPNTAAAKTRVEALQSELAAELPGQTITASIEGDTVFLRGNVKDLVAADRAVTVASSAGKVVDLLYVDIPPTDAQILLKVQFATVDRTAETDLGLNLINTGAGNSVGTVGTGQFPMPTVAPGNGGAPPTLTLSQALNLFWFNPSLNLGATIKALETRGLAEILAEPNVLAINGKPASFLAGGEFPYPILQGGGAGLGTVTIAFRQFGVRIDFLPVITPRGTIRLDVAPEVSALDYANGLTVSGYTVPGLDSRKLQTEIELKDGQSFAIGGLLDKRLTDTIERIPLLASIPLLGKLFQSRTVTKENNELLVIITPQIVRPIPAGQTLPQLNFPSAPGIAHTENEKVPQTPGTDVTGPETVAGERLPVEELLRRMKVESDMKLQQQGGTNSSWPPQSMTSLGGSSTSSATPVK